MHPRLTQQRAVAASLIGAGEGRGEDAVEVIEDAARELGCPRCFEMQKAVVLAELERYDEAIEIWERVRDRPVLAEAGGFERTAARVRLGPLFEAVGNSEAAIAANEDLVAAWQNADAELRPQVARAQERIAALRGSLVP